ncbi:MAG: hypothetical protein HQL54_00900 [Magnetococcales bacterium]|nr:hypothetical protein [Magnetococcales bacterium]
MAHYNELNGCSTSQYESVYMEFRVGVEEIKKRNRNLVLGGVFAGILVLITWMGHQRSSEQYNATLLFSVLVFVVLATVINLIGHVRYLKRIRNHVLMVQKGVIIFRTGKNDTQLKVTDIQSLQQQKRWREGPSILLRLKNKRIIRLVGYENLGTLENQIRSQMESVESQAE